MSLSQPFVPLLNGIGVKILRKNRPLTERISSKICRLQQISVEIAAYQDSTSRVNKQAALLRATDALDDLDEKVLERRLSSSANTIAPYHSSVAQIN